MLFTHLVLCTIVISITLSAFATSEDPSRSILNDLASGSKGLAAIGLINQKVVALFGSVPISGDSFEQMIVFDTDSTVFSSNADKHIVSLIGNGKPVSSLWPKLSFAFKNASINIQHLTTIAGDGGSEYFFAGTESDQANVLYDLKTEKSVIKASGIKVSNTKQLVSSNKPKKFYDFRNGGSSYQYSLHSIKGNLASGAASSNSEDNFNFCINQKDSGYVAVFSQNCKGTVGWPLAGGGFSDGQHFHLFTEKQVLIVPMNVKLQKSSFKKKGNDSGDDESESPVKVIALTDYFGDGTMVDRGLAFLKGHILYVVICGVVLVVVVLLCIMICCCCCKQGKQKKGSGSGSGQSGGDEVSVSGHHHQHHRPTSHQQGKSKNSSHQHSFAPSSSRGGGGAHSNQHSNRPHSHSNPRPQVTHLDNRNYGPGGGKSAGNTPAKKTVVGTSTVLPSYTTALGGGRNPQQQNKAAKPKPKSAGKAHSNTKKKTSKMTSRTTPKQQGPSKVGASPSVTKSSSKNTSSGRGSSSSKGNKNKKKRKRGGKIRRHAGRRGRRHKLRKARPKMPTLINDTLMNSDEAIHRPVPSKKK